VRWRGAAVVARMERNDNKKRPSMKVASVSAVAVTIVPMQTPKQPTNLSTRRSLQSEMQIKRAPTCTDVRISGLKRRKD
jgi:hypothetical protein